MSTFPDVAGLSIPDAVDAYQQAGFIPFPVRDKKPLVQWTTPFPASAWQRADGIALRMVMQDGVKLVTVDVDAPEMCTLDLHHTAKTRRGFHAIYVQPAGRNIGNTGVLKAAHGCDVRGGEAGYIVVAPSANREWIKHDVPELPADLAAMLPDRGTEKAITDDEANELLADVASVKPDETWLAFVRERVAEWPDEPIRSVMLADTADLAWMCFTGQASMTDVEAYCDAYAGSVRCSPWPDARGDAYTAFLGALRMGPPVIWEDVAGNNLPSSFWASTETLSHIRDAAWSWYRSPDAVLHAVLARLAAVNPPQRRAATGIGKAASLNYAAVLAGPPGSGKSTASACAEELLPFPDAVDVREAGLGSGEGLAELYMDGAGKDRQQTYQHAFVYVDEGAVLSELKDRSGATLWSTIRTAISGETLGQANATKDRSRRVEKHTYSMGLLVGFQPSTIQPLLSDTGSGMSQRFVYASATDPSIPDAGPDWPGPLRYAPRQQAITFDAGVTGVMRADVLARVRGEAAEGDEHGMLTRARLAALLAILHGAGHVDGQFWDLAGMLWDTSCTVRESLRQAGQVDAERRERAVHEEVARREVVKARAVEDDALDRAVKNAARYLDKHPGAPERDVWNSLYSKLRKQVDRGEVIERLRSAGLL